jgi:hypothetical protein
VARKIELIHQRPHAFFVDASARRNQAGPDFDNESHYCCLFGKERR